MGMFNQSHHYGMGDLAKRRATEREHARMPTESVDDRMSTYAICGLLAGLAFVVRLCW